MRVTFSAATLAILSQFVSADGISKTFIPETTVIDATTSVNYGTLSGQTSWVRSGIRATDTLDFLIELEAELPSAADLPTTGVVPNELTELYQYELVFCKDSTSTQSEYINIRSAASTSGVVQDTVTVGTYNLNVADISYAVGSAWPLDTLKTQVASYTYELSVSDALLTSGSPDPNYWQLATSLSSRN